MYFRTEVENGHRLIRGCLNSYIELSRCAPNESFEPPKIDCTLGNLTLEVAQRLVDDRQYRSQLHDREIYVTRFRTWAQSNLSPMITAHQDDVENTCKFIQRFISQFIETSLEMRRLGSLCDKETSSVDKYTPAAVIHKLQEQELHRTITRSQTYINPYGYALSDISVCNRFFHPWMVSTKEPLERHEPLKEVLQTSNGYERAKYNIKFIEKYLAEDVVVFACASSDGPNPVGTGKVRISQAKDFCWRNLREKWDFENWCPLPDGQKNPPIRRLTDRDDLPVQEESSTAEKGK
ncbi:hypothetical protein PIIN_10753 [Serendipita indica DSM 11827]|uniref:Uncharacterized protein n=1 Tax=Serendipita indica (strain DSM 11827) TaxID=1109443 RepID=G4TZM3_SERID|nr:hypothetical protein PIIN_10753 [Serendipita indica DSM 11827]